MFVAHTHVCLVVNYAHGDMFCGEAVKCIAGIINSQLKLDLWNCRAQTANKR